MHPTLEHIRRGLARAEAPRVDPAESIYAAVAVVLRDRGAGPEVLFIERAMREGDPWAGHMAFPGGRLEPGDASARIAACRETREEVGIELAEAEFLGDLGALAGRSGAPRPAIVSAHAFHLASDQPLLLDRQEVRSAFWFPLAELRSAARRTTFAIRELPGRDFPGIVVGEPGRHVVWGLTYRFLESMFARLELPLHSGSAGSPPPGA